MIPDTIMKQKVQDRGGLLENDQCFKPLESEMKQFFVTAIAIKSGQYFKIDLTFSSLNYCLKPEQGEVSKQVR